MMRILLLVTLATGLAGFDAANVRAAPQQGTFYFYDQHPIPYYFGGGFCYHKGPHKHLYDPQTMPFFRQVGHVHYFIGDPVYHGYVGKVHFVWGRHPISIVHGGGYCYIRGPHRHVFNPVEKRSPYAPKYRTVNGYYRYQGPYQPDFQQSTYVDLHAYYVTPRYNTIHVDVGYRPVRPVFVYRAETYPVGFHVHVVHRAPVIVAPRPLIRVHLGGPRVLFHVGPGPVRYHRHEYRRYEHRKFKHRKFKHRKFKHYKRGKHHGRW
ncbi:MAG: hypothetical protein KC609_25880 [Myxococcales bacterium]|nr:hypothetical protein [Myxococcales bacterium]